MAGSRRTDRSDLQDDARTAWSRRTLCRSAVVAVLPLTTGCSEVTSILGGDPGEVTVFNDTDAGVTATVTVTNLDEETTVLSETTDVSAGGAAKFDDVFESPARYRFEVRTEDGRSGTHEWDLPSTDHYLFATVRSDAVEFEENSP